MKFQDFLALIQNVNLSLQQPGGVNFNGDYVSVGRPILEVTAQVGDWTRFSVGTGVDGRFRHCQIAANLKPVTAMLSKNNPVPVTDPVPVTLNLPNRLLLTTAVCILIHVAYKDFTDVLPPEFEPFSQPPPKTPFRLKHLIPPGFIDQQIFLELSTKHRTDPLFEARCYHQTMTKIVFLTTLVCNGMVFITLSAVTFACFRVVQAVLSSAVGKVVDKAKPKIVALTRSNYTLQFCVGLFAFAAFPFIFRSANSAAGVVYGVLYFSVMRVMGNHKSDHEEPLQFEEDFSPSQG